MTSQQELIPMRPGEVLRFEREQKGLSLERVASESRIKATVLSAIEEGETSQIPSVYLKGYIRNYARYLGIDPAEIEDQIDRAEGATPEVRTVFTVNSRRGRAEKWLKASSYLAASVLIAALAWQFTHEAVRFSQGESSISSAQQSSGDVAGEPGRESSAGERPAKSHLNASIASVEVLRQRGEMSAGAAAEQAWAAVGDPDDSADAAGGRHRLSITTSADTWVEISGAGETQLEMDLVRAGTTRHYSDTGPFRVMVGRASAVQMTFDGEAVDLGPHTRGNVAHLTLAQAPRADLSEPPSGEPGTAAGEEQH